MNKSRILHVIFNLSFFLFNSLLSADKPNFKLKSELNYLIYFYISYEPNLSLDTKKWVSEESFGTMFYKLGPKREYSLKLDESRFPAYLIFFHSPDGNPPRISSLFRIFKLDPKKNKKIFISIKIDKNKFIGVVPQKGAFGILKVSDNIENNQIKDFGSIYFRLKK